MRKCNRKFNIRAARRSIGVAKREERASEVQAKRCWKWWPVRRRPAFTPRLRCCRGRGTSFRPILYDSMALLSYAFVVPLFALADVLVPVLFGAAFEPSVAILRIHVWSFLFIAFGIVRRRWLVAENMTQFSM